MTYSCSAMEVTSSFKVSCCDLASLRFHLVRHADLRFFSGKPKEDVMKNFYYKFPSVAAIRVPRRDLILFTGFGPMLLGLRPVLAAPPPETKEPEVIRTLKLANGVRYQEVIEGEGPEAHDGDLVEVNYVCRRANGYFVHSTVDQFSGESSPVKLALDENQTIKGLKDVLIGMKVGGKRRALIPPSVGYINDKLEPVPQEFGPRRSLLSHANEPLVFEVQIMKILRPYYYTVMYLNLS